MNRGLSTRRMSRRVLWVGAGLTLAVGVAVLTFFADSAPEDNRKLFGLWRTRYVLLAMALAGSRSEEHT